MTRNMTTAKEVLELARPEILAMTAYVPGRAVGLWLDNNESPWPTPGVEPSLNRYPDPPCRLHRLVAEYLGVAEEQVLATRGSDDGIDALIRCFCAADRDSILVSPPTFGMYAVMATIQGAGVIEQPLDENFAYPLEDVISRLAEMAAPAGRCGSVKLVFVCSPNNPTGTPVPASAIASLCEAAEGRAVVVVDEAYAEFMGEPGAIPLLARFDNLVILRTLSKALALAGARCGVLLGSPGVLELVRKVLPPYLLPQPTVEAAEQVLQPAALDELGKRLEIIGKERARMVRELEQLDCVRRVCPSAANFLLVTFVDAGAIAAQLASAGIIVRRFVRAPLENALRITIGLPEENDRLLEVLAREGVSA